MELTTEIGVKSLEQSGLTTRRLREAELPISQAALNSKIQKKVAYSIINFWEVLTWKPVAYQRLDLIDDVAERGKILKHGDVNGVEIDVSPVAVKADYAFDAKIAGVVKSGEPVLPTLHVVVVVAAAAAVVVIILVLLLQEETIVKGAEIRSRARASTTIAPNRRRVVVLQMRQLPSTITRLDSSDEMTKKIRRHRRQNVDALDGRKSLQVSRLGFNGIGSPSRQRRRRRRRLVDVPIIGVRSYSRFDVGKYAREEIRFEARRIDDSHFLEKTKKCQNAFAVEMIVAEALGDAVEAKNARVSMIDVGDDGRQQVADFAAQTFDVDQAVGVEIVEGIVEMHEDDARLQIFDR